MQNVWQMFLVHVYPFLDEKFKDPNPTFQVQDFVVNLSTGVKICFPKSEVSSESNQFLRTFKLKICFSRTFKTLNLPSLGFSRWVKTLAQYFMDQWHTAYQYMTFIFCCSDLTFFWRVVLNSFINFPNTITCLYLCRHFLKTEGNK